MDTKDHSSQTGPKIGSSLEKKKVALIRICTPNFWFTMPTLYQLNYWDRPILLPLKEDRLVQIRSRKSLRTQQWNGYEYSTDNSSHLFTLSLDSSTFQSCSECPDSEPMFSSFCVSFTSNSFFSRCTLSKSLFTFCKYNNIKYSKISVSSHSY